METDGIEKLFDPQLYLSPYSLGKLIEWKHYKMLTEIKRYQTLPTR